MNLPDIKNIDVSGKTVLLRADLDIPLSEDRIEDDTRLMAGLPMIQYLLEKGAKVIICGKLGRPDKKFQISNFKFPISNEEKEFSLESVARWFMDKLQPKTYNLQPSKIGAFWGWNLSENLFLLENLLFYQGEKENDPQFAKELASLADIYVNDAFAMCHRDHASVTGVAKLLPHFAGFHLQKEIEELSDVLKAPKRPLVVVIGGKKIETKLPLVLKMHQFADYVLVGGKIAQQAQLVKEQHRNIKGRKSALLVADLNSDGSDITPTEAENFLQIIFLAKTVIWNGPLGIINENPEMEKGTKMVAEGIVKSGAYSVVGGGDTTEFLKRIGLYEKFDFVSTGGGAMLSFLAGEKLPGLESLLV